MVYVNSQKFACESCIKGHRSSSCHHTDRPLFEIKKKGRPVSQCTKCRELRQSKKFHSKCNCNHQKESAPAVQPLASSSGSKTRRFIPIVPALPNGLRDVMAASQSPIILPPDSRQRVDSLLNPCECKSVWKCKCRDSKNSASSVPDPCVPQSSDALSTLAHAAAMCCASPPSTSEPPNVINLRMRTTRSPSGPTTPVYTSNKRHKHHEKYSPTPGPELAPIFYTPSSSSSQSASLPEFPSMPSMSEITSFAGSGCTCGVECSCPGCLEHRGPEHASHERHDCADGCGTCVDPSISVLPNLSGSSASQTGPGASFLDRFFARAAALPPPPVHRKMAFYNLDPMDTTIYMDSTRPMGSQSFAFGSVNLPKLECCGGQCHCPADRCCCRTSCAGCCVDATENGQSPERVTIEPHPRSTVEDLPVHSCCAGKV